VRTFSALMNLNHGTRSVPYMAILTIGVSWLIYPFFASSIIRKNYLRKGWTQVN